MTEHLQRARYEPLGDRVNYRNGHRPRRLNLFGLGQVQLKVPRDRQSTFKSLVLPERKGQDAVGQPQSDQMSMGTGLLPKETRGRSKPRLCAPLPGPALAEDPLEDVAEARAIRSRTSPA